MKLRIAIASVLLPFSRERKNTYVVQKRIGFFWWQTIAYCDSLTQARCYVRHTLEDRRQERIVKVKERYSS
jgi:dTDP-glucose pyrophosphorylase